MASDFDSRDGRMEKSSIPLDIDNIHLLLQVEQEQIQKRTFTNWVNAQLVKRRPPCRIVDLFEDFRDGSRLLDLLEVMSGQRISRERGRGMFQHRSNIEKCLSFLKKKSIKLVNINIPDIIDGKPSIILGLIWTIILQYHIEELASGLSFSSRQSSMESLASLDSSLSSRSASSSPVPTQTPLHSKFRVSAKKALMLWVREQCHKAGCSVNVKDFKASWRSGVVFLAVLSALRPGVVDLNKASTRSNKQNLEEAFRVAERELRIPRLLEPDDVDVRDPDEKSIMTYVAQFLQYSREMPVSEEEMQTQFVAPAKSPSPVNLPAHYTPAISASPLRQVTPDRKVQEVTCWLNQAYDELLEGWDSTEGESYSERYHVIHTFLVSFNEQRRPIMPLLTAMRRTPKLSEDQRSLRQAWDALTEKLREYKMELDVTLPDPLNSVARWLLRTEAALAEEEGDPQDHERAADDAREKQELLKACLEEMPQQVRTFQTFQNLDEYGNMLVPTDKTDELKRRFTSVRVTAKYHGIKLEYREHRHSVLDLLGQIRNKLRLWKRPYVSSEGVRVLLHEWHELVDRQELPSLLEAALYKLKQVSERYSSKSALASDYHHVIQQVKQLEEDTALVLEEVKAVKCTMGRVMSAWDSYSDCLSSLQAWLQQGSRSHSLEHRAEVLSESLAEWGSRHAHLNEVGSFLIESSDPQTSRALSEELRRLNTLWAEFVKRNTFDRAAEPGAEFEARPQDLQALIREATLILKEPLETMAAPLRTYRKRLQFLMMRIKEVDVEAVAPSPECTAEQLQKLKQAVPEVMQTLFEAEQVCAELQHSVSGLDSRLAELLHWETEARDLYQLLKASERQQRGQDPRARVLISRGLQLEGQVVTEEQDLQLMVMTNQKNSPLQYLHASALQDRVRSVVALSQEAVGMLSSLGSRRERSKSPPEGPPPSKVFIQAKTEPQHVTQRETRTTTHTTRIQETFEPKIVVQELRLEKTASPPMPYSYAEAVTRTKSPTDVKTHIRTEIVLEKRQTQGQRVMNEPQSEQTVIQMEVQEQPEEVVHLSQIQQTEHKQEQTVERQQVEQVVTHEMVEKQESELHEKSLAEKASVKKTLSAQEIQSRKAQAMKNRPWLQKTADSTQGQVQIDKTQLQMEKEAVEAPTEPVKQAQQPKREQPKQPKEQKVQQQQPKEHQKPPHPVRPTQTHSVPLPEIQIQASNQSQNVVQTKAETVVNVKQVQIEGQAPPQAHSPTKPQTVTQISELQPQTWGRVSPSSPVPMRPPSPSHIQLRSHPQSWAPVRPPSPKPPTQTQPQIQQQFHAPTAEKAHPPGQIIQDAQIHTVSQVQTVSQSHSLPKMQAQIMPPQPHSMPQTHVQQMPQQPQRLTQIQQPQQPPQIQQPMVQTPQMQAWMQYRGPSQVPMQPPQAAPQGQIYPKTYPQQWAPTQEQPRQTMPQQRPQMPQPYPQMQAYPPAQWTQQGYSQMGYSQQWTQEQMRPPSSMQQQQQQQQQQVRAYNVVQMQQGPVQQQQTWIQQPSPQGYPPPQQYPPQRYQPPMPPQAYPPQPPMPPQAYPPQPPAQVQPKLHTQPQIQAQATIQHQYQPPQTKVQMQPNVEPKQVVKAEQMQPTVQSTQTKPIFLPQAAPELQQGSYFPTKGMSESLPQPKVKPELAPQSISQAPMKFESPTQPKVMTQTAPQMISQAPTKPESSPQPKVKAETGGPMAPVKFESSTQAKVTTQTPAQTISQAPIKLESSPQPKVMPQAPPQASPKLESPTQPRIQPQTPSEPQPKAQIPAPPQARTQPQSPPSKPPPSAQTKPPLVQTLVNIVTQHEVDSPEVCDSPPALAQAPPQAYTEAYLKAQALARNGFEEAKHCLQEHIKEAINVFEDKCVSAEQVSAKEETLRTLEPELLEEFLRAAKGMEAFCTPSQLRDMELFTQSIRMQWELCFSADGSFARAGSHLEALKTLCDTLSPEDAHRLAQTQLRECENRLAAIQRQYSGDQDAPLPETRISVAFSEDVTAQRELPKPSEKPQSSPEVSVKTVPLEKKEVEKQVSVEEDGTKKEALEKYENCKRMLQAQLAKNEQSIQDVPSDSVSLKGLHTRLQEIQFLRQETEALWSDFTSQSALLSASPGLEQERAELQEQWRLQQLSLQRRGSSLGAALRQIDSTENHMVDFTDRLDRYLRQPKDISGFTLANTNILRDIKELDDNIQSELGQLSRLDPDSSDLDPRDCFPLSREVEAHRSSLDQLRQQVRKSDAAARALDRFLMSLRTVDEDISGVQSAPFSDPTDGRSKLSMIRQSIDSLKDKAPQLDLLLQGARLTVTRDGAPASCLDMVNALLRKLEEVDGALASQQQSLQKETQNKSLGLRKRTLLAELRKLQDTIEMQGLKEPTIPAVQQRLRALSDLDSQLQTLHSELQSLRQLQEKQDGGENLLEEVEAQWDETRGALSGRKQQCSVLLDLLKKFQSCRSQLSSPLQRAEQTVSEQASYMGKENLQKCIMKVTEIKEELGGLRGPMEELRGVCRQLQSHLKKIPDCNQAPFEAEADSLMDNWLDVTEKTDAYLDNLKVALELWEKQLMEGTEVDSWAGAKLALFAASHPFHNEQQVLAMRDDINKNEETIEHFHRKSIEIQEMLQSQESPLELQVIETQLRKRMDQVKELFTDCTDVFEELMAVKKHLTEKIEECQSAVETLQSSLVKCDASKPDAERQLQDLSEELEAQEDQAEASLKEVSLVSSVASPQALEALSVDCSRLREAIARTKEMIHLKREERDKGLLKVLRDERQSFEEWFQDLQLSVNECFENPESTANVETAKQRLTGFLKSTDPERRLDQLKDQLERGRRQIPSEQLTELTDFLKEQQEEVSTFRTHCENRQKQMEALLSDLSSLQKQSSSFSEWLQLKEKQAAEPEKVRNLLRELQDASVRGSALSDLLASIRRQGVRGDALLKDTDNLLQRFRNLESRLQERAQNQDALDEKLSRFKTQSENTLTWIKDLLRPVRESPPEEIRHYAQSVLRSKPEGDSRLTELRLQSQSLSDQEELDSSRRHEVQQRIRETEEAWRTALDAAEEALKTAETRARLDRDLEEFEIQNDAVQTWISDQDQQLRSLRLLPVEERVQEALSCLSSKPKGDSLVQDLNRRGQTLSENRALDDGRRRSLRDAVKQTEGQWSEVSRAAEEALNAAESEAAAQREYEAFKDQSESVQAWIREQKQKLMSITGLGTFEERLQLAQVALNSKPEGDSRIRDLEKQAQRVSEDLDDSRRSEVEQTLKEAEQQWKAALQTARQAELRSLSDDFDAQTKTTQSWIRDRHQQLLSVSSQTPLNDKISTAQTVLSSKPEGDCKVNNLRRRGQTLCDHPDSSETRRAQVQQTVRDTEEQWRTVQGAAKQTQTSAETQIAQETESREKQLREFNSQKEETCLWLKDLQQRLNSLRERPTAEDRLQTAQAILSSRPEGDSKLQELKRKGQSLSPDFDEQKKTVADVEDQWSQLLQSVRLVLDQSERQCAVENLLRDYQNLKDKTTAWIEEKRERINSLDVDEKSEETINAAQAILSSKPEGDCKLSDLRRQTQSLLDRDDVDEDTRRDAERVATEAEYRWRDVLRNAEDTLSRAEVRYSLLREMDAFRTQARSTEAWVDDLRRQLESKGRGAKGSQAQLEDRLNTAQMILSCRLNGDSQLKELRRRAQSLTENVNLDGDRRRDAERTVKETEQQWSKVLQTAEDAQRQLQGVLERLVTYNFQRSQLESRLSELQRQTSGLPRLFPWPGLGERRQAADQTRTMLDQTTALAPTLADARKQAAELTEITQDPSWTSTNWDEMERSIPALLKELTEALCFLEEGVLTERQCTQLMEQHEAAQDWLREQVKGLGPTPTDEQGLHSTVNTLKALLQTVHREQREMKELDDARDTLLNLCTPGGRDALTLDVSHLHDLCASSEREVKQHLTSCEARLQEMDKQTAQRTRGLKEKTSALQWELRSLDQALSYSQPQNNIAQLQQHWHSLKNCEKSLEGLRVKLDDLLQEVSSAPTTEITTVLKSLCQQHDSLKLRLNDHQTSCSTNTARYLKDCLQNLQRWSHRKTPESAGSLQETLEEGEKYRFDLQEALSHRPFLSECLTPNAFEKLEQDSSEIICEAVTQKNTLHEKKEELDARPKHKPTVSQTSEEVSVVAPPRKHKRSPEKKGQIKPSGSIQSIDKSTDDEEKLMFVVEPTQLEPVVCIKDRPKRLSEPVVYEQIQFESIKKDTREETDVLLQSEPASVDSKDVSPASSQETPVPLRRKTKTVATEPEMKHMKLEAEIPQFNQETSETKRVSTIILEEPQSFLVPGEITSKDEERVVIEQVQTIIEMSKAEAMSTSEVSPVKTETLSLASSEVVVPKRKPKSPKLPPKPMEMDVKEPESPEAERSAATSDTKLIPTRRKSKTTPPTEIFINKDSEKQQETRAQETPKLSPTKRRSKTAKASLETAVKETKMAKEKSQDVSTTQDEELKEPKEYQGTVKEQKETVEELKLVVPKRKSKMAEIPQKESEIQVENVEEETKLVPSRRRSKTAGMYASTESVNASEARAAPEIGNGKMPPPKRKPKSPKSSPAVVKKDVEADTQSISSIQDVDSTTTLPLTEPETEKSIGENGKLSPTKRKSKSRPKVSPELLKKDGSKDEPKMEASPIETAENISAPKRKPKGAKVPQEEALIQVSAPESVVETAGSISPPKRKSKSQIWELQDSSVQAKVWPMEAQKEGMEMQTKKVATIILEMPDTVPEMVSEETIFTPKESIQQHLTPKEAVVLKDNAKEIREPQKEVVSTVKEQMKIKQTPSKEAAVPQKVQLQTSTDSFSPVSVGFDGFGDIQEKKVATIILEMPETICPTITQPEMSERPDITEKTMQKDLKVVHKDVSEQKQKPQRARKEVDVTQKSEISTKDISPILKPAVHVDESVAAEEIQEKKVAIVVLEMPEEPPKTTSVEKDLKTLPTKEALMDTRKATEQKPKQEQDKPKAETSQITTKETIQVISKVCETTTTQMKFTDGMQELQDKKVATIVLEMEDGVSPTVTESEQKDLKTPEKGLAIISESQLQPKREQKDVTAAVDRVPKTTKSEQKDSRVEPVPTTKKEEVSAGEPQLAKKDTGEKIKAPLPTKKADVTQREEMQMSPKKSEPTSLQQQDRKDLVEDVSKQMQKAVIPQGVEIQTSLKGVSPVHEKTTVGDAETIQGNLERTKQIMMQPEQTAKEVSVDTKLRQKTEPPSNQKQEEVVPQETESGVEGSGRVCVMPTDKFEDKDKEKITVDSLKMRKTPESDEKAMEPDLNGEAEAVVYLEETMEPQKEAEKQALVVKQGPQVTLESKKTELKQSLEAAVVAEETVVEYISIVKKSTVQVEAIEKTQEEKVSDVLPETSRGVSHLETPKTIKTDLTTSTSSPQTGDLEAPVLAPPSGLQDKFKEPPREVPPQNEPVEVVGKPSAETLSVEEEVWEEPEASAMKNIFSEIQLLAETGPNSQLLKVKPVEEAPETLVASVRPAAEDRVNQLLCKVLLCKNQPAVLSPSDMALQLKEAQECREAALAQVSLLSEQRRAADVSSDAADLVEDQWRCTAQDLDAVIQKKETHLKLVTDYSQHLQEARTSLDELRKELDTVAEFPGESSSEEAERLALLQKTLEKKRTIFIQLLLIYKKLYILFTRSERAAAENDLKNLQNQWRVVEKSVERSLYHKNILSYVTNSIKTEISDLMGQLQSISKDLEAKTVTDEEWSCKEAQKLMVLNAKVNAAHQKYRHLKQLSDELLTNSQSEKDTKEIEEGLQRVKARVRQTEELILSKTKTSINPIMEKILAVMRDGFAWAKKTETDIEGRRKRVALLPEDVHRQLRDLKKLQSDVMNKHGQLEALVEEVSELLPQLDESEEVPVVDESFKSLEELSKSTTEKLVTAVREIESGLQTREKLSQQIADLDSWIMCLLNKEALSCSDFKLSTPELERKSRQIQETQAEAEKQATICESLLSKSKEMAPELSITENCLLFDRLTNLQDDIQDVIEREKKNKKDVEECIQMVESSKQKLTPVEKSLRQMSVDLNRHKFPITNKSLQALQPLKNTISEHKSQVELCEQWIPQEKTRELRGLISELENKMAALESKSKDHEMYLNLRKFLEELKENVKVQVRREKEETRELEKYKICQSLLVQFPSINELCQELRAKLQTISTDLYPSQLNAEQQRLKQTEENLNTMEISLNNNLSIIERNLMKDMDLETEEKASKAFLKKTLSELNKAAAIKPTEADVNKEYQRMVALRKTVELRMRAWEVLRQKANRQEVGPVDLTEMKREVLRECDKQLESVVEARESLRSYSASVKRVVLFLIHVEVRLLYRHGSSGLCSERRDQIHQALDSLDEDFQNHVEQLQSRLPQNRFLSPSDVARLQEKTISQLLVMMTTVKAKAQIELDRLSRCVEQYKNYCQNREEILQSLEKSENSLTELISQKVTCLSDCSEQQTKLKSLCSEVESLQKRLSELKEWCPEPSCRRRRETTSDVFWRRVSRLRRCTEKLSTRCEQRITEWSEITDSVEKAESVLSQVEAELPEVSQLKAMTEELQDLVQSWEQYQDRLDCEHRALSALELRVARLLGVPAHLEQAPPTPLCQQLQAMQRRYNRVKKASSAGLEASRLELEDRERLRDELQGLKVWTEAADVLLSETEPSSSPQELQEVHLQLFTQKSLLQRILDALKTKYSDPDTVVPVEIDGLLQDVTQMLQQVEPKVGEAVEKSGPVYRLGAKLAEIQAGLHSVQKRLEQKSPTAAEAKVTQKRVWDELDVWHSCLAALEVEMQDLDRPEEALLLTERLVEVQQHHSQLAKQAEQRTTLLSKIHTWLQEHQEMINSSKSWMNEAQTWLAAPATYTSAKCLNSHVHALQVVLGDSAQIRSTLQGFSVVLEEMSQVCDVTSLQQQLVDADRQVAAVQDSFTSPLSQLQHAAAEVGAIEAEVRKMESNVAEIKNLLASPEDLPSPKTQRLKVVEQKIQSMQRTINEVQKCKPGLCLPETAEETLTVFAVVNHLQILLLELEKKVPALFVHQPQSPTQSQASPFMPRLQKSTSDEKEEGEIQIVHVKEDVLKRSGAELLTVERSSPEQRTSQSPDAAQEPEVVMAEEAEADDQQIQEAKEVDSEDAGSIPAADSMVNPSPTETSKSSRCVVS